MRALLLLRRMNSVSDAISEMRFSMVEQEVILAELKTALAEVEERHGVVIVLREVDIFDAEYVRKNGVPPMIVELESDVSLRHAEDGEQ